MSTDTTPETQRVDIGGRTLALACSGEGWPCVFLETGLGAEAAEWDAVQRGIAAFTRVCRYDRAGRGASPAAPAPRRVDDLLDDLHALLHTPGLREGRCLLVGQSLGGLLVRRYAERHPRDVAGLLLVDSMHERQFERLGPLFPLPSDADSPMLQAMRAFWQDGWRDPARNPEGLDFGKSFADANDDAALPEGLPLTVLSAGGFLDAKLFPNGSGAVLQAEWLELQGSLAARGRPVEHVYLEGSGHFVQRDRPEAIVEAVQRMVLRLRSL
jgi:pimeloyl-ACP methyl ester carboxylesterase